MGSELRILALEPYFGLSHRSFLEGYQRWSRHRVEIWNLPPRKWKWRMRGSAFQFAARAREAGSSPPDAVLASDFLNLADWRALAPREYRERPSILYFHESQLRYPLGEHAPVEHHYGWINLSSALAAHLVLFNSAYHRELFLDEVRAVLGRMPDSVPPDLLPELERKSSVFPVGIDFTLHERLRGAVAPWPAEDPVLLWNHRWEYDKGPERFAGALLELARRGTRFRAVVCGESFGRPHPAFERLADGLGCRLLHLGFFPSQEEYLRALAGAHVVVSTALHEFFGVSVVEAVYLGCIPALPNDLSYPEIIPAHLHPRVLYDRGASLADFLERLLADPPLAAAEELQRAAARYDWRVLAPELDVVFDELASRPPHSGAGP